MPVASSRPREPATWELVLKRNPVERLKQEKAPLRIRDELPALIAMGYESVPEEDVVRLQWWGLYHDKPKVGTFMLRLKIPSGILPPAKLRAIGEVSNRYGRGDAELSTRQCIQLHWLRLDELPNVFGNLDFTNLPRKHKYTIASCADRCNAPEINCVSLIGVVKDGRDGFAVKVGGGLSSVPRIARDLGVFVPVEEAIEILAAITNVWSEDLRYRVSRVKARLKFMVDDVGAEGMRERVEARLGRKLEDFELPAIDVPPSNHIGVHAQKQDGLSYIGVPVRVGLASGDQLIAVADLVESFGGDFRITRQQNFVVTGVPNERIDEVVAQLEEIGFPLSTNNIWANSIGCTGEPHCNFSVGETKQRLAPLVVHLEGVFGDQIADLRLHLDGCPHACAQHWVGDLGFQGTTGKDADGRRVPAYDIFVRGSLGP